MQISIGISVNGARTSGSAPVNIVAPGISGTTTIDSVLTSTLGGWLNSPTSYAFQWNRNGSPIPSATTSSYTLVQADSASAITCVVTATNAFGSTPSTSNTLTTPTYAAAFTSTWLVTAGETITLPYEAAGTYSGTIDWGDSTTSVNSYDNRTHTYATAGTKTISITGVTTGFRFNNTGSRLNIRTITNWGTLRLGNGGNYLNGCSNLTLTTVVGTLDLTGTTNLNGMFWACSSLTTVNGINSWNTAAVTSIGQMFHSCTNFNQALSFNTGAVTNMSNMFQSCTAFNAALSFSSTASVTNMYAMFYNCTNFNQPLTFNTVSVTNMGYMFGQCAFNQNIGSWNVANVTDFEGFMANKTPATFSTTNLDAIYNGWVTVQSSRTISFGTAKYSAAGVAGRNYLTTTKLWTITDGGL
tara:strand:+ start:802 stop:2040 length:1239 start_codon:yes stop_codon:yes gene_type:complete